VVTRAPTGRGGGPPRQPLDHGLRVPGVREVVAQQQLPVTGLTGRRAAVEQATLPATGPLGR
jgi:hypothetical protein